LLYHVGAVLGVRKTALRVLVLIVVVWAALAVIGGAVYVAKRGGDSGHGAAIKKTGLGLCAVTVAVLLGKGMGCVRRPRPERGFVVVAGKPREDVPRPIFRPNRARPGPSLTRLLQVFRT